MYTARPVFNYTLPEDWYAHGQHNHPSHGPRIPNHHTFVSPSQLQLSPSVSPRDDYLDYPPALGRGGASTIAMHQRNMAPIVHQDRKKHSMYPTEMVSSGAPHIHSSRQEYRTPPTPPISPRIIPAATISGNRHHCEHPDCQDPDTGKFQRSFTRRADLGRHSKTQHGTDVDGNPLPKIDCPKPKCHRKGDNGFTRRDHLVEHRRSYHGELIPKRNRGSSKGDPE